MTVDLAALPLILCGPMVRRVTQTSVAFWVALKQPQQVSAVVLDAAGHVAARGQISTIPLGKHLHIALVVARGNLAWGDTYSYNLQFGEDAIDLLSSGVVATDRASAVALLSYRHIDAAAPELPSFALPPKDLNRVRLVHASCRLLQGQGNDALVGLDMMLAEAADSTAVRPQQLFLMGDQIYADSLPDAMAQRMTQIGNQLLGWSETTADDHSLALAQFYACYIFAWSDVLWPDDAGDAKLAQTKQALPAVRRALANISTLMMFDDHEVTDDWYLTLEWTERALTQPTDRRLIMNALCSYAVFQAWGNTPEQFDGAQPGAKLLEQLIAWRGQSDDNAESEICSLVGMPSASDLLAHEPPQLKPSPNAIDWHYRAETPAYDVLVLDTRTWRSFPGEAKNAPPAMLSAAGYDAQIHAAGPLRKPLTIVISSSVVINLPKTWYARAMIWLHYRYEAYKQDRPQGYADVYGPDRGDWWSARPETVVQLLAALVANAPIEGHQQRARVLLLVGDMHVGGAARVQYWGNSGERPTTLVGAQMLSSPLKHEAGGTRLAHKTGYRLFAGPPTLRVRRPGSAYRVDFIRADDRTEIVGRNHIAELVFDWSDEHKHVTQIAWWQAGKRSALAPRSHFRVSLDYTHPDYPAVQPA